MARRERKGSGGRRKYGRNKDICQRYRIEHRREKNKITRLGAMIKNLSSENNMRKQAEARIKELKEFAELK